MGVFSPHSLDCLPRVRLGHAQHADSHLASGDKFIGLSSSVFWRLFRLCHALGTDGCSWALSEHVAGLAHVFLVPGVDATLLLSKAEDQGPSGAHASPETCLLRQKLLVDQL